MSPTTPPVSSPPSETQTQSAALVGGRIVVSEGDALVRRKFTFALQLSGVPRGWRLVLVEAELSARPNVMAPWATLTWCLWNAPVDNTLACPPSIDAEVAQLAKSVLLAHTTVTVSAEVPGPRRLTRDQAAAWGRGAAR